MGVKHSEEFDRLTFSATSSVSIALKLDARRRKAGLADPTTSLNDVMNDE